MQSLPNETAAPSSRAERKARNGGLWRRRRVCAYFGIVDRTLARWLKDERLGFPYPAVTVHGIDYFHEHEIRTFKPRHSAQEAASFDAEEGR
jgi:hypothetical protein